MAGTADKYDLDGPWLYSLPPCWRYIPDSDSDVSDEEDDARDPSLVMVVRFGDKHYVITMPGYEAMEDNPDENCLRFWSMGVLSNPVYPIGPSTPLEAYTTTTTITGTFVPKSLVGPDSSLASLHQDQGGPVGGKGETGPSSSKPSALSNKVVITGNIPSAPWGRMTEGFTTKWSFQRT